MSQLKKGALLTYLNILLTNIIGLVLTPFIIKSLGNSEYGLYTLIGSFVAYLGLMNLGINNAIIRFVAKYNAQNNKQGEKVFLGTIMWIYIFISVILLILGVILYYNFEDIFSKSLVGEEMVKGKIMFLLFLFNLSFSIPGGSFLAICNAYERFVFTRMISIVRYIVRAITLFVVLIYGGKAISIVIIDTVLSIISISIAAFYVFNNLNIKISMKSYDKCLINEIFSYSLWVFLFGIVYKFQWNAGQIILGIDTNTITVAIYGIGILLGGYYGAFSGGINGVLIPRATQMVVKNSSGKILTAAMIKIGRLNTFILFFILSGFILFGKAFILLWVGETYKMSWSIALMIMCAMTLPLIQAFGNSLLEARKKNRYKTILSIITMGSAVIIGSTLVKDYGIYGVAIPLISAVVINSIVMNFYYKKIFNFEIVYFFSKTILRPLLVYFTITIISYLLIYNMNLTNWFSFLLSITLYGFVCILIIYFVLMNDYEKSLIKGIVKFKK